MFTVSLRQLPPLLAHGIRASVLGHGIIEGGKDCNLDLLVLRHRTPIAAEEGRVRVAVWTGGGRLPLAEALGVDAVLAFDCTPSELRKAIERFAPVGSVDAGASETPNITPRERDVLNRVATGATSREIAAALSISERTVEVHRRNLLKKLGVRRSAGLVSTARARQLFD